MLANPECFDPAQVVAGTTVCNVNASTYISACETAGGTICTEQMFLGNTKMEVNMQVFVCVPLVCGLTDIYVMLETSANTECVADGFTTCQLAMCGVTYSYTPPTTPSPAPGCKSKQGVSPGGAAGLAIAMLAVGGVAGAGALWFVKVRRQGMTATTGTTKGAFASTSYTDL